MPRCDGRELARDLRGRVPRGRRRGRDADGQPLPLGTQRSSEPQNLDLGNGGPAVVAQAGGDDTTADGGQPQDSGPMRELEIEEVSADEHQQVRVPITVRIAPLPVYDAAVDVDASDDGDPRARP
jgi:hypothetical protein